MKEVSCLIHVSTEYYSIGTVRKKELICGPLTIYNNRPVPSMKIVHICFSSFYIDNYSYQENMLPKYHVLQGHDVTVIASLVSFDRDGIPCLLPHESSSQVQEGFKVLRVDYKRPFYKLNRFIRRYNNTYNLLEQERPDLLFIHDFSFFDIISVLKYLKKNRHVKVIVDCHTDYINSAKTWVSKNIFHHLIWRFYAGKLDSFVSQFYGVTPLRCDFLRIAYNIPQDKIELLEMGVDDQVLLKKRKIFNREDFAKQLDVDPSNFIIVTGGKIDKEKNIHLVLQAANELSNPKIQLIVFGTVAPDFQQDFDVLLKAGVAKFVGWLTADEILDYFIFADLVIFPGTHSVLWEQAVGCGTPTIFKYWDGMTHIDVGGNCRFLYKGNAEELKMVISDLVNNENEYNEMKLASIQKGLTRFAYSEISRKSIANI